MFLEAVIVELSGQPAIGAGILHRICVAKQREFFDPPNLSRSTGTSKYRRRARDHTGPKYSSRTLHQKEWAPLPRAHSGIRTAIDQGELAIPHATYSDTTIVLVKRTKRTDSGERNEQGN